MPIERVVEYKITVPRHAALDIIFRVGLLGMFMPIDRPSKLPAPSIDQEVYSGVRGLIETARVIAKYNQFPQDLNIGKFSIKVSSFRDLVESVYKSGGELISRIRQIEDSLNNLEGDLLRYRLLIKVNSLVGPTQFRNIKYVVLEIPIRSLRDFENSVKQIEDAMLIKLEETNDRAYLLVVSPTWELGKVSDMARLHNVRQVDLPEADAQNADARIKELEASLSNLREQLNSLINNNKAKIRGILDAANIAESVIQTYVNSAVEEGGEV
ncbi:MAG: hypothetical protein RXQ73_04850, partial [Caldivirga sp.]